MPGHIDPKDVHHVINAVARSSDVKDMQREGVSGVGLEVLGAHSLELVGLKREDSWQRIDCRERLVPCLTTYKETLP